jgi:hypothetical protein
VTVCIAALANSGKSLVLVTDSKVAFGEFSADGAIQKSVPIAFGQAIEVAGNDVAKFGAIINRTKARLALLPDDLNTDEAAEIVFEECKRERDRIAEAKILNKHGFDKTFRTRGKELCTSELFYDLHTKLEQVTLSLDFMISGFDAKGVAHIRFTNCETPPEDYDALGFYAIGSGAPAAMASLSYAVEHFILSAHSEVGDVVYHAMAAKFMAESATDVGQDTFVVVMHLEKGEEDHTVCRFMPVLGGDEYVKQRWKDEGAPRIPPKIAIEINELLCGPDDESKNEATLTRISPYLPKAKERLQQLRKFNLLNSQNLEMPKIKP